MTEGESYFRRVLDSLENDKLTAEVIICYSDVLNQSGILWSARQKPEESKKCLVKAENLYQEFKDSNTTPLSISDIFGTEIEKGKGDLNLEKTHTLTLYYLAQVFGQEGDLHTSAHYCHLTLKRQLEFNDFEPIDWALNAATLSQYYFSKNELKQSRHLLAAAQHMLDKFSTDLEQNQELSEEQKSSQTEILKHRTADVARCWAKYAIYILSTSQERLMQEKEGEPENMPSPVKPKPDCEVFTTLDLSLYERQITDEFVLTFEDAKEVFLTAQNWLNVAKEYYRIDNEASEYSKIVQDFASLFKYLAFFEDDLCNQAKLQKRRADQLETLVGALNPTYYLNVCREVWYELGLVYSVMLDIKLDLLGNQTMHSRPSPHALNKINSLCKKSIEKFKQFLDSYKDKDGLIPDNIEEDELQPILFSYFHIARLYYKFMTPDKHLTLDNISNSLKYYQTFVKKCDEHENLAALMKGELGVCREMTQLLPLKIGKLTEEIHSA